MIVIVGLSHHTAPIAIREQVALSDDEASQLIQDLNTSEEIAEVFAVSTCNRVELVVVAAQDSPEGIGAAQKRAEASLVARCSEAARVLYTHHGGDAVRHLVRVASSLDSLVVGEAQILGQLKKGFERARESSAVGPVLHQLFACAARGAKRVRSETSIGAGQVSVPSIAVELAGQIFDDLSGTEAVLIGNGEMGQTVARLLKDAGAELTVVGRNLERITPVANRVGGRARLLSDLPEVLVSANVVVSSTSAPNHVLTPAELEPRRKSRRAGNLFLIDLAVPRDIDPQVGERSGVFLYDVDDLSQVAAESAESRKKEADSAGVIVDHVVEDWERRSQAAQVTPTIKALRAKMRVGLEAELDRSLRGRLRDLDGEQRAALAKMLDAGLNRILHDPITHLREEAERSDGGTSAEELAATLSELFELEDVDDGDLDIPSVRVPSRDSKPPSHSKIARASRAPASDSSEAELTQAK